MKKSGFSMIELVFVIVILGVLAAVAVPRFVTTRTDAQVAMLRSDMASTLKAVPARVFAENIDPTAGTAPGGMDWAEWIIDTGGLDRGRWKADGNFVHVRTATTFGAAGSTAAEACNGNYLGVESANGNLVFNPGLISTANTGNQTGKLLCEGLKNSYPSNSNRIIPLATTGAVKF